MRFLYNEPALMYRDALIVGDTHFGIEQRLQRQGIRAQGISEQMAQHLIQLARGHKARRIIFLGDVKEGITRVDPITREIFEKLKKEFLITIVRGNHDGGIEELGVEVIAGEGLRYGSLGLIHGHSWPGAHVMAARYIVSAHQHPQLTLNDKFGKPHSEPVWVIADGDRAVLRKKYEKTHTDVQLIVVPAFNPLVGFDLKKLSGGQLGPLINNNVFKWSAALVVRLNGNSVGKINQLL